MTHQLWMPCRESTSASDTPAPALPGAQSQADAQLLYVSRDSASLACMECYQVAASLCLAYPHQRMQIHKYLSPLISCSILPAHEVLLALIPEHSNTLAEEYLAQIIAALCSCRPAGCRLRRKSPFCGMTRTLLNSTLSLDGLFEAAAAGRDHSAANAWLQTHLDGCLMRSAAMLSRAVAEQYRSIAPACQQVGACAHYQHGFMQSFYHISPDGD